MRRGQHGWNLASDSIRFQKISEALTVSDPQGTVYFSFSYFSYFFCLFFFCLLDSLGYCQGPEASNLPDPSQEDNLDRMATSLVSFS